MELGLSLVQFCYGEKRDSPFMIYQMPETGAARSMLKCSEVEFYPQLVDRFESLIHYRCNTASVL